MFEEMQRNLEKMKEREQERKAVVNSPMAIVGYVWDVIRNLITLAIVFGVYSKLLSDDSVLIFSGLLLTYLAILTVGAGIGQYSVRSSLAVLNMQLKTQKMLLAGKLEESDDEMQEAEAELAKAGYMAEKLQYKFFINAAFLSILYIVAILHLL